MGIIPHASVLESCFTSMYADICVITTAAHADGSVMSGHKSQVILHTDETDLPAAGQRLCVSLIRDKAVIFLIRY